MKKINKIVNASLIFTLIGVFLGQNIAYSSDTFYLRAPIGRIPTGKTQGVVLALVFDKLSSKKDVGTFIADVDEMGRKGMFDSYEFTKEFIEFYGGLESGLQNTIGETLGKKIIEGTKALININVGDCWILGEYYMKNPVPHQVLNLIILASDPRATGGFIPSELNKEAVNTLHKIYNSLSKGERFRLRTYLNGVASGIIPWVGPLREIGAPGGYPLILAMRLGTAEENSSIPEGQNRISYPDSSTSSLPKSDQPLASNQGVGSEEEGIKSGSAQKSSPEELESAVERGIEGVFAMWRQGSISRDDVFSKLVELGISYKSNAITLLDKRKTKVDDEEQLLIEEAMKVIEVARRMRVKFEEHRKYSSVNVRLDLWDLVKENRKEAVMELLRAVNDDGLQALAAGLLASATRYDLKLAEEIYMKLQTNVQAQYINELGSLCAYSHYSNPDYTVVPIFLKALEHPRSSTIRRAAAEYLRQILEPNKATPAGHWLKSVEIAMPILINHVNDKDSEVQEPIRRLLDSIGTAEAIEALEGRPIEQTKWGKFIGHFDTASLETPREGASILIEAEDLYDYSHFSDTKKVLKSIYTLPKISGGVGLDIGFGSTLKELLTLQKHFNLGLLHGIDRNAHRVVDMAHELNYSFPSGPKMRSRFKVHHLSSEQILKKFGPNSFDIIYSAGAEVYFHYDKIIKALKPGGFFIGPGLSYKGYEGKPLFRNVKFLQEHPLVVQKLLPRSTKTKQKPRKDDSYGQKSTYGRPIGTMHSGATRFEALKRLLRMKGIDIEVWANEQQEGMTPEDRVVLVRALKTIGLTEVQIENISNKIILCEVPQEIRLESRGKNASRIGGLIVKTKDGHKILFPKDRVKDVNNKQYLADLLHEVIELDLIEKGVVVDRAHEVAIAARNAFLRGDKDIVSADAESATKEAIVVGAMHEEEHEIGQKYGPHGHIINGGVSHGQSGSREIIHVNWDRDEALQKFYDKILFQSGIRSIAVSLSGIQKGNAIRNVFSAVLWNIDRSEPAAYKLAHRYLNQKVLIGEATIGKGGACRHFGIITAAILERLIEEGYLKGKVYYVRGLGYGWAVYETSGGERWVLDAMQKDKICPMETESFDSAIGKQLYKQYFPKEIVKVGPGDNVLLKVGPGDNVLYRLKAKTFEKISYKAGIPIVMKAASKELQILSYKDFLIVNPVLAKQLNPDVKYYLIDPNDNGGFKGIKDNEEIVFGKSDPGRFNLTADVSRKHFKIKREGDSFIIQDLGSTNGTFIHPASGIVGSMHEEIRASIEGAQRTREQL